MRGWRFVPECGTIAPEMGTKATWGREVAALFGKTRRAVLSLLFCHPDEAFHLREIVRLTGAGQGAVQRELERLARAGLIIRRQKGNLVLHQANRCSPVFAELQSLMLKTAGLADPLRNALAPVADRIRVAFVYGSVARGEATPDGDVDVLIVGKVTLAEVAPLVRQAEDRIGREVNVAIYPETEFQAKSRSGHAFLSRVLEGPKIFLVGDADELERMAGKGLAETTSGESQ